MASTQSPSMTTLNGELREIKLKTKPVRIQHCIKYFLKLRYAGWSPNAMQFAYGLSSRDMYRTVLDAVHQETGIDRDDLLKYPGRGRGLRGPITRYPRIEEQLSEAEEIIQIYEDLEAQANYLLKIARAAPNESIGGK